jgi:replicative DNA helicase Mcm
MSISEEILKLIENGITDWDEIYNRLIRNYSKSTVSSAKKRLIQQGKIKEETINGKKILSIPKIVNSYEEEFEKKYGQTLRDYIKSKITEYKDNPAFSIRDFALNCMMPEINEDITNHPLKAREILNKIYSEIYHEHYWELPDKKITIYNTLNKPKRITEINSKDINKLIEFEGMVIQSSKIMPRTETASYICMGCGKEITVKMGIWDSPLKLKLTCPNCQTTMTYNDENSTMIDFQEIRIQELELSEDGRQRDVTAFIEGFEKGVYSGKLKVVGVPIKKPKKDSSVSDMFIYVVHYEELDKQEISITEEDIENIKKISKDPEVVNKLSEFMLKKTKGHDNIKKAIFLQQIKGTDYGDGRNNLNILMVTDPGVGKTTMMFQLKQYYNVHYASINSTSGPGLTASVVAEKTEFGDKWVVKPGAFALADGGTLCLDELTSDEHVHKHLLTPMESQIIPVNKAGINTILPSQCAVLAACNPKWGRFDPNQGVMEQIKIHKALLDRFDLIFPLRDMPDKKRDRELAAHIRERKNNILKGFNETVKINGVELTVDLVSKYMLYAQELKPIISDKAGKLIEEFYSNLRNSSNTIAVSARQVEALYRIAEAHAKAKLKDVVDEEDAKIGIELIEEFLKQVAYDPETGQYDIDKAMGELPKSKVNKMDKIMGIIKELSETSDNGLAHGEDIWEVAKEKYRIYEEEVESILEMLKKSGEIYSPKFEYYKIT